MAKKNMTETILVRNDSIDDNIQFNSNDIDQAKTKVEKKELIPSNYIEVKLDSLGKLSSPKTLHFRNYNMNETLKLSAARKSEAHEIIVECLNGMCYEDFDCGQLTEQEIIEILLTIYGTWIDSHIKGLQYYINLNPTTMNIDDPKNIGRIDIPVKSLKTIPLDEKFKEPINITIDDTTIKFRLPRFNDFIFANEFIKEKYFAEERQFSDIEDTIQKNNSIRENKKNNIEKVKFSEELLNDGNNDTVVVEEETIIDYQSLKSYQNFLKRKSDDFVDILMMQLLIQYNDIVLDTIEKKIEYYNFISFDFWETIETCIKDFKFGINENITFKSPHYEEPISRMFRFSLEMFLPNNKSKRLERAKISFG
jgi:hypothetical protein